MSSYFEALADRLDDVTTPHWGDAVHEAVGVLRTLAGGDDEPEELPAEPCERLCMRWDCRHRQMPLPSSQKGFASANEPELCTREVPPPPDPSRRN